MSSENPQSSDPDIKYIVAHGKTIKVVRKFSVNGHAPIWTDENGTVYGFPEEGYTTDHVIRLGVGPLSLPQSNKYTPVAVFHDAAYTIPVYQIYHTRAEADAQLEIQSKIISPGLSGSFAGRWMRIAARLFGGIFWEQKDTR